MGLGDRLGYLLPLPDLQALHGERGRAEEGLNFNNDNLVVSINKSKADQRCKGRQVVITKSDTPFCFMQLRHKYLRRLNRKAQFKFNTCVIPDIGTDNEFVFERPMPYVKFYERFKVALASIGRDPDKIGLHFAKVGSIVEMADNGADL